MKISKVKISNILGIEELEFSAGSFVEISGRNGQGKTSVLTAIRNVFEGGHDATLIRDGAEKGEIVLLMDDGTRIRKGITKKSVQIGVEKNGVKADKPQSMIDALVDHLSNNPVAFLTAPAKKKVDVLLESIPMKVNPARIAKIVGHEPDPKWPLDQHALVAIQAVYDAVFDERTGTNRAIREKKGTIKQLEDAIPTDAGGIEITGNIDELLIQRTAADEKRDTELKRISDKIASLKLLSDAMKDDIRKVNQEKIDGYRQTIAELNELIADATKEQADSLAAETTKFSETERKAETQRTKARTTHAADVEPINAQISAIQRDQESASRIRVTRQTIATMESEVEQLGGDESRQSAALDALTAYKSELLDQLPIPGLEVRDGKLFRNNVPFDHLNTAQQVEIAVEVAKIRAGELGVICVDGIELMDSATYRSFQEQVEESGLQMIVARVADNELKITNN